MKTFNVLGWFGFDIQSVHWRALQRLRDGLVSLPAADKAREQAIEALDAEIDRQQNENANENQTTYSSGG